MQRISLAWAAAASFLSVGGLFLLVIPVALHGVDNALALDAALLFGPLVGGFVAALATGRRSIAEVGLGALLALLFFVGIALLLESADVIDSLADSEVLSRMVRLGALLCVGAMAGAGLGHRVGRWRAGKRIEAPLFWFLVAGLATVAATFFVAALLLQAAEEPTVLGLIMLSVGPAIGGFIAQHMAPTKQRRSIALGCAALLSLLFVSVPGGADALPGFPIPWLFGWLGAVASTRLREPPGDNAVSVPQARVED